MGDESNLASNRITTDVYLDKVVRALGDRVDQYSLLQVESRESMLRFANNEATTVNYGHTAAVQVYITKGKKKALGVISELSNDVIISTYIEQLIEAMRLSKRADVSTLPGGRHRFHVLKDLDAGISNGDMFSMAKQGMDACLEVGSERAAGSVMMEDTRFSILTSSGTRATEERSSAMLSIRAIKNRGSGAAVSISTHLNGLDPVTAGKTAAINAKKSQDPVKVEPGIYDVLLAPSVSASLIQLFGSAASAFSVEAGLSFLAGKLGKHTASELFNLVDYGQIKGGIGSRAFDDEGSPTEITSIVKDGILTHYLHNSTTAEKANTVSTGNAGIIDPSPWNLVAEGGSEPVDHIIGSIKKGILLTNNWYTRFQNYRTGEFSTLARDAAFIIFNGEIAQSIHGSRLSDNLPRLFESIKSISKERAWIKWWGEVTIPVLAPYLLVKDSRITTPT